MANGEIAHYEQFLLFLQGFQKSSAVESESIYMRVTVKSYGSCGHFHRILTKLSDYPVEFISIPIPFSIIKVIIHNDFKSHINKLLHTLT